MRIKPLIVVVHDDLSQDDPIVLRLKEKYHDSNVITFRDIKTARKFIIDNLSKKIIVILDWNFGDGNDSNAGFRLFKQVREKTHLVFFIIYTAQGNSIRVKEWKELINNNDAFAFLENAKDGVEEIIESVENAEHQLEVRVDCALENWVLRFSPEKRDLPFMKTKEGIFSLNQLLHEIRIQSTAGRRIEKNILDSAIELLEQDKQPDL